jgi:teichoic acid transport system ATP-binding protein
VAETTDVLDRRDAPQEERPPTVIVDDVHLVYRIAGRRSRVNAPAALFRLVRREPPTGGVREIHAVRGISLVAHRGDAIGLIGPNGSGKSTLLRGIAGLMGPDKGIIYTQGEPALLGIGAALMHDMTGERNIEIGCLAMGMTPEEVREHRQGIIDFADIGEFISYPMNTYSSGMGARLRFAIAAAKTREVLLIDEALATGDASFRRKSEDRIRELCDEAGTIFLVSHGLQVIRDTCNRVLWLEKGLVVMDGPTEDVVDAYEDKYDPRARNRRLQMVDEGASVDDSSSSPDAF